MDGFWRKYWRGNTPPSETPSETPPGSPEPDWRAARESMVSTQLRSRGIRDEQLLKVMAQIPRHRFVPPEVQDRAYEDRPTPIGCAQTISQPYMVAAMTELLALQPTDRVLEIGTGSGYQSAVLAALAQEVYTIERHTDLAEQARETLAELGVHNVTVVVGDGTQGHPEAAPYNAILVTAGAPAVPAALKNQLAVGGRLLCPVGDREMQQLCRIVRRSEAEFDEEDGIKCIFVPLLGRSGWPENTH